MNGGQKALAAGVMLGFAIAAVFDALTNRTSAGLIFAVLVVALAIDTKGEW